MLKACSLTRTTLRAGSLLLLAATMLSGSLLAEKPRGDAMDQQLHWVIKSKCAKCHDDLGARAAGDIDYLLELDRLSEDWLDASNEDTINDLILGEDARMPQDGGEIQWNGPLSDSEKQLFRNWIDRGGPSEEYLAGDGQAARPVISIPDMSRMIAADLQSLRGSERRSARYLTITNLHNNPSIGAQSLETYRAGLVKTLNSLSSSADVLGLDTSKAVNRLVAIDAARTIFRFDLRHIGWKSETWDLIASRYPYGISSTSGYQATIASSTSSTQPHLRGDWFTFSSLQPPLYHKLVGIPATLGELEKLLSIDRLRAIRDGEVARAGMIESKVSVNNRLIERIVLMIRSGYYHISYDFASNDGIQNFFEFPLGPPGAFETEKGFRHDGGEIIFSLPNGYQAYMLVDAKGSRLDIAPQSIVQDGTMPGSVIINGISCLSCHYQGMKPERYSPKLDHLDDVRAAVVDNRVRFTAAEEELVSELHPEHSRFRELLEQDRKKFLAALDASGIPQRGTVEPARVLFDRFTRNLDTDALAGDYGMTVPELKKEMDRHAAARQVLRRAERGQLKRQLFLAEHGRIARLIGLGDAEKFTTLPFPYFGDKVNDFVHNVAVETTTNPTFGNTGIDLIDAENQGSALKVELWTENNRSHYVEGEKMRCRIRANQDCFLTLITVDSLGDMTLLMPNKWHPQLPLQGNRSITIPTPQMDFEFPVQPPHGATLLKAIVTKRPLKLKDVSNEAFESSLIVGLGRAKGFGVQRKTHPNSFQPTPIRQSFHPAAPITLTDQAIRSQFGDNEWATASWTLGTRKR